MTVVPTASFAAEAPRVCFIKDRRKALVSPLSPLKGEEPPKKGLFFWREIWSEEIESDCQERNGSMAGDTNTCMKERPCDSLASKKETETCTASSVAGVSKTLFLIHDMRSSFIARRINKLWYE